MNRYTLSEVVEHGALQFGERTALTAVNGTPLTFRDVERHTRRIAMELRSLGIEPGDRVAIVSESRVEWGPACFGIFRAGAVAVPILPDFSPEQIGNIIAHSGARCLLVSSRHEARLKDLPPLACGSLRVEDLLSLPEHTLPDTIEDKAQPDDLALILYTSGSMGLSKGVMLTHRNILSNVEGSRIFIEITPKDRFLSILPLAHAYEFTLGLVNALWFGASVYYLDRPPSESVLLPALAAVRPTILLTVPLVIEKIYRARIRPALDGMPLSSQPTVRRLYSRLAGRKLMRSFGGRVRFFGIGGAPLDPEVDAFLSAAHFPYSIGYGLTETAPLLTGNVPGKVIRHTTGIATRGVDIRIADPRPDTGAGEIQVRGLNITPGYYRDPERTADLFTEDGWLRTGDLGVMDAHGRVTVKGRLKTVILGASGENIYPEEVEAVLNSSPYVLESLVFGGAKGLTALVQLNPEALTATQDASRREPETQRTPAESHRTAQETWDEIKDGVARIEKAVGEAFAHAEEHWEEAKTRLVERIRQEANMRLAAFSRLAKVRIQEEPFEKTPTQKIKRFMYGEE